MAEEIKEPEEVKAFKFMCNGCGAYFPVNGNTDIVIGKKGSSSADLNIKCPRCTRSDTVQYSVFLP